MPTFSHCQVSVGMCQARQGVCSSPRGITEQRDALGEGSLRYFNISAPSVWAGDLLRSATVG